jgi:hypothetical protein
METIAFTEETFGKCFHKAAIVKSNGNVRLEAKVATAFIENAMEKTASKKLFRLISSVMDDNHDTYKTANIKITQLFFWSALLST